MPEFRTTILTAGKTATGIQVPKCPCGGAIGFKPLFS